MQNKTLAITRGCIPYYKELRQVAGSVTATILMQQLDYWFEKQNGEPFYKFKAPCENKYYKEGDSFTEELGFSIEEFTNAFSKIGFSYKSKTEFENTADKFQGMFYCSYFDRKEGLTFYFRNHELLDTKLNELFTVKRESPFTENEKVHLQKAGKSISPIYITEEYNSRLQQKKDTASGFSSYENSYSEIPNSSTKEFLVEQKQDGQQDYILNTSKKSGAQGGSKNGILGGKLSNNSMNTKVDRVDHGGAQKEKFQDFWKEFCNMCKAKGSTAGEKKPAQIEYQKAVKIAGHQGIMRTLEVFRDYILLAFENNKHAYRWLKNIHWPDFEEAINNYKQQSEVLKAEAKKQGKPLPVAQKTPEKQQEEVEMKKDAQKKREGVIRRLNGEEMQFMKHIKEVLKTNFDVKFHGNWIDDFVFSCRNNVAYFGFTQQKYIKTLNQSLEKFKQCVMREIATFEGLNAERIELKLID